MGANDVLIGGAGADTLAVSGASASAVTLTGGAGVDAFVVNTFAPANAGAAVTITDFTKGETIQFATGATADFSTTKVVLIAESTFTEYVADAIAQATANATATNGGAAATHGIAWFQFGGNTFIVQDVDGSTAFSTGDIIVKLTGAVDLSSSSFNTQGDGTLLYI